jgi:probable F420-dependent oxidoreductase
MKTGIVFWATARTADIVTLARHVEQLGFESLWLVDHPIIPVDFKTPFPGGGSMPQEYTQLMEPLVALAAAAGATERIRLGTGILLIPERHPLVTAKEIATLDLVSNGRLELGIGAGWLKEEGEILGTHWARRWTQTREYILAMKTCWREEIAEFHGEFIDFPPLYSDPKPLQQPHPPIHIAGELARSVERISEYGNGWIPRHGRISPQDLAIARRGIENRYRQHGRSFADFQLTLFNCPPEPEAYRQYAGAGVDRVLHILPVSGEQEALRCLDDWAEKLLGI